MQTRRDPPRPHPDPLPPRWERATPAQPQSHFDLDRLFNPRSIAIVGASPNPSFVNNMLTNLLRYGFSGTVAAVNPRYEQVLGAPCYTSIEAMPGPIDLVIVGIANRLVPGLLEQAERKRVGGLCIVSSGYSEIGQPEGVQRQAELAAWSIRTGIPIVGPNCLGLMNVPVGLVSFAIIFELLRPGAVACVLQSGQMTSSLLSPLFARDIGVSQAVTTGNEVVLEAADYIAHFAQDPATRVIACFTEQIRTPARFVAACELAAEQGKPIVMLKIGRSEGSRRAALAHTGSLVGADAVTDLVLRRLGVTRVDSVDEMCEAIAIFHTRKLPHGGGVASILVSGGAAGMLADLAEDRGVSFPVLADSTVEKLRQVVPEFGSVGNPLDVTGQGVFDEAILNGALDALAEDPAIDIVAYGRGFPSRLDRQALLGRALERAVARNPEVLFLVLGLAGGQLYASQVIDAPPLEPIVQLDGVPFLQGADYSLAAIAALVRYAQFQQWRKNPVDGRLTAPEVREQARALVAAADGRPLTERQSKQVLALYGLPTSCEQLATTAEQALRAAEEIGYPIALKVESPDLPHKSEAGAILLDIAGPAELRAGFELVLANARAAVPRADLRGVLVSEMVGPGVEVLFGLTRDEQFGPVVAVGLGGVFVEVLRDLQLLLPPIGQSEAEEALERLRGAALLHGVRGAAPADVPALIEAICRFGELALDLADLVSEIDVNPLIVGPFGRGLRAVDALIVPAVTGEEG